MIERLTGDVLLAKVEELGTDCAKEDLVFQCGYYFPLAEGEEAVFQKDGNRLDFAGFYEALLEAKGADIGGRKAAAEAAAAKLWVNGKTQQELTDWCEENRPPLNEFGTLANAVLMHKYFAVKQLEDLQLFCWKQNLDAKKDEEHEDAATWNRHVKGVGEALKRLKAVDFGEEDPAFEAYEGTNDDYLNTISDNSLEVLKCFGAEAPHILNEYSTSLEDVLMEQVKMIADLQDQVQTATGNRPHPEYQDNLRDKIAAIRSKLPTTDSTGS